MKDYYPLNEMVGLPGMPLSYRGVKKQADCGKFTKTRLVDAKGGPGGKRLEIHLGNLPLITQQHLVDQHILSLPVKICPLPEPETAYLPATVRASSSALVKREELTIAQLKGWQRRCMDARIFFMRMIAQAVTEGYTVKAAIETIITRAHRGDLPYGAETMMHSANQRSGGNPSPPALSPKGERELASDRTLSASTLDKWWMVWQKSGHNPLSLAPKSVEKLTPREIAE